MRYVVISGVHHVQGADVCEYQIHSVYETSVGRRFPELFMENFLYGRKGHNVNPKDWFFYTKALNIASHIDGERIHWADILIIENNDTRKWYGFIHESEFMKGLFGRFKEN